MPQRGWLKHLVTGWSSLTTIICNNRPYPWFCFLQFQLLVVNSAPKILNGSSRTKNSQVLNCAPFWAAWQNPKSPVLSCLKYESFPCLAYQCCSVKMHRKKNIAHINLKICSFRHHLGSWNVSSRDKGELLYLGHSSCRWLGPLVLLHVISDSLCGSSIWSYQKGKPK
jgi:hypothetical protein